MKLEDIRNCEIELTANCNAECPICNRTRQKMPLTGNTTLSLQDVKDIFPTSEYIKDKSFSLCGVLGDPIVAPDCIDICKYLSDNGASFISISTNAGYNTANWWQELASIPRVEVVFAVDGFSETNHIYRVNVNWKLVERNMRAYCAAGGKGTWRYIVFEHNEHELPDAQSLAEELDLKFIFRTGGRNEFSSGKKHIPRKANPVIIQTSKKYTHDENIDKIKKINKSVRSRDIERIESFVPTIKCRHLETNYIYVGSNKTLWHCCYLYGKNIDFSTFGTVDKNWNNLAVHTIEEIISHDLFVNIMKMWSPKSDNYIGHCLTTCGANGAYLDKNHEISKKNS